MPLVIYSLGVNTHTHTHTNIYIHYTYGHKSNFKSLWVAGAWFKNQRNKIIVAYNGRLTYLLSISTYYQPVHCLKGLCCTWRILNSSINLYYYNMVLKKGLQPTMMKGEIQQH